MKLFKAMATVAGFTMLSRIAGMFRDIMTAAFMGAGPLADAFFVALKLPNFFRRIAAEGAFSISFIPIYSKTLETEGEDASGQFSGRVFSIMGLILSLFTIVMILAMPLVIHVIAPGFDEGTERYDLAVTLTQLTFPYLLLMSLTAMFGGMLNAHNHFAPFAAAPIIFNLSMVVAILIGAQWAPTVAHAMAVGIAVSGVLQLALMVYFIFRYKIKFFFQPIVLDDKVKKLFILMGPGILGAGVFQINLFVDMMIASLLAEGSISYLYYADRINQLPLSLAGIAVGTALLPMLSRALAAKDFDESKSLYNRSLEFCFIIAIPAAVAILVVPIPLIATLYEYGKFTYEDTRITAMVLMGYGLGLPAYIAGKVFMTSFWSHQDTMTPVKISIVTTVCNIILCFAFIYTPLGVAGIALATGIAGWLQLYLLRRAMKDHHILTFDERLKTVFPKIIWSSLAMAIVLSAIGYFMQSWFHGEIWQKLVAISVLLGLGGGTYIALVHFTGILTYQDLKKYLTRSKKNDQNPSPHSLGDAT